MFDVDDCDIIITISKFLHNFLKIQNSNTSIIPSMSYANYVKSMKLFISSFCLGPEFINK